MIWRLSQTFFFKKARFQGQGSIRLWLGSLLVLCACSALEGVVRIAAHDASGNDAAGRWIAASLGSVFGTAFSVLLLLLTAIVTLPWLFGRNALPLHAWIPKRAGTSGGDAVRAHPGRAERARPDSLPAARPQADDAGAASSRKVHAIRDMPRKDARAQPSATGAWKLPGRYFGKDAVGKPVSPLQEGAPKPLPARPREEWEPFESIRPTEAMLARARSMAAAEAQAPLTETIRIAAPSPSSLPSAAPKRVPGLPIRPPRQPDAGRNDAVAAPRPWQRPPAESVPAQAAASLPLEPSLPAAEPAVAVPAPVPSTVEAPHPVMTPTLHAPDLPARLARDLHDLQDAPAANDLMHAVPGIPETPAAPAPQEIQVSRIAPETAATMLEQAEPPEQPEPSQPVAPWTQAAAAPAHIPTHIPAASPRQPQGDAFAFQAPSGIDVDLPGLDLLDMPDDAAVEVPAAALAEIGQLIEQRLKEFKVPVTVLGACAGPVITRFEIEPAVGVRGAQIVGLMKDLSRALGLTSIRVVETIPGKTCMGLELPNARRQMIRLSEMLKSDAYRASASHLTLAMGKDITGIPVVTDLARAPHMLVAGTTGSGKSVAVNAMILSLLYKATPADVRMIMIDPKMLELSVYDGIPHLLAPVVTDMKLAANALTWCVAEMEKRYRLMSAISVRNLAGFNQKIREARAAGRHVPNPFSLTPDAPEPLSTLPTIVVVIDELADLMMVAGKKIEELIARLAQKARAAGIHLVLATQRPSVDVITGLIKANIPTRVAFQVSSKIDSRTVLDQMGAETLLGHGDMLFLPPGSGYPQRVHGAFVSDEEVHRVVEHLKQFGEPEYEEAILAGAPSEEGNVDLLGDPPSAEADPLYDEAVAFVIRSRRASISAVQRQLRIGYNRAARLVEQMETAGILSSMSANGSREVLVPASAG
ncbi:DNA translocase FtsK [Noviherbaspirillum galbum]|uniref:DNA translocase FtsK n=1 Tax=Noviherbaspirillum galbum TaxID=2709383 RepID=UPI001F1EB455|nr:DNA translocase FtsK [Noviherbaspirillum galbum]